jgi:SAM-dependent MidA family methyltransferase
MTGFRVGNRERQPGLGRVVRPRGRRAFCREIGPAEDEEVEVQLARPPAFAFLAPERALERLQGRQEAEGARSLVGTGRHVKSHDGVPELGLVRLAPRSRRIQARHAAQPHTRQGGQGPNAGGQGGGGIAKIRTEPNVGADTPGPRARTATAARSWRATAPGCRRSVIRHHGAHDRAYEPRPSGPAIVPQARRGGQVMRRPRARIAAERGRAPGLARRASDEPRRAQDEHWELPASDPVLVERLRAEIAAAGPITFARFMSLALTDPERGYYATSDDRPTRAGDFLTAPELHPIFGATLARAVDEMWRAMDRPAGFLLREYGAGSGRLAVDLLDGLRSEDSQLLEVVRYEPVDIVPAHVERVRQRVAEAGFARSVEGEAKSSSPAAGCVIANEFLDALPVHRLVVLAGRLHEIYVGWADEADDRTDDRADELSGGRFVDVLGEPSTPALVDRLSGEEISLAEGQRAEVCLALDAWTAEMSAAFRAGFALILDYGRPAAELYGASRPAGTLLSYAGHRAHEDPYAAVGRQDLTAHVDFTAVERAAASHGWRALGLTTQAEFLVGSGMADLLARRRSDPGLSAADYLALRASVGRLLDPVALGGFRVLVLGRDVRADVRPAGLVYRVRG